MSLLGSPWGPDPRRRGERSGHTTGIEPRSKRPAAGECPSMRSRLRVVIPIVPMLAALVIAGLYGNMVQAGCAVMVMVGVGLLLLRDRIVERRAERQTDPVPRDP